MGRTETGFEEPICSPDFAGVEAEPSGECGGIRGDSKEFQAEGSIVLLSVHQL
jgi:hypothetical protein